MNYLVALLAFSAIMIVLTTLVTVLVEGAHKLLGSRSRDFEEMLARLYENSVKPNLQHAGVEALESSEEFVRQMRENPALAYANKRFLSKYFVKTDFEELTTRQFVEQFAQSTVGQKLAERVAQEEQAVLTHVIANLSYEFERYGQAASEYFRRRAAFFAILIAFAMTVTLNVDAIRLYESLARDTALANSIVSQIDIEKLKQANTVAVAEAVSSAERQNITENYQNILSRYDAATQQLMASGLPIGKGYYPFCSGDTGDERCHVLLNNAGVAARVFQVISSSDGWAWLLRVILTTGLIGLGAPFWYKTYRFAAQFIPGRQYPPSESTQSRGAMVSATPAQKAQPPVNITVLQPSASDVSTADVAPQPVARRGFSPDADVQPQSDSTPAEPVSLKTQSAVLSPQAVGLHNDALYSIFYNSAISQLDTTAQTR